MIKQKLKFLALSVLLLALPAAMQAQVLVEDGFAGSAGALPDAAKFDWGGKTHAGFPNPGPKTLKKNVKKACYPPTAV